MKPEGSYEPHGCQTIGSQRIGTQIGKIIAENLE